MRYTTETFIEKARKVHDDRYTYEKVNYVDSKTKVIITCPKHGDYEQLPTVHLRGGKCMECSFDDKRKPRLTTEEVIKRFKKVHGDKYDYSKVSYVNPDTKVAIICPKHDEFEQLPFAHMNGNCCPRCHGMYQTQDEIIGKFHKAHGGKYDYSKVNFTKTKTKVCIICPEHGEFWQTPEKHISGRGCPKCGKKSMAKKIRSTTKDFIEKSVLIHRNKYDYTKSIYKNAKEKLIITCPHHGDFIQIPNDHLCGHGCPKCGSNATYSEDAIYEFVKGVCPDAEQGNRTILAGFELDVYIPSKKLAIEYNGLKWHSEEFGKDEKYHLNKTLKCAEKGIQLIHIFEDEWLEKQDIVKSRIKNTLGLTENTLYARKCDVREVPYKICEEFLNKNHLQGNVMSKYRYGLYFNNELVSLMTFGKRRKNMGATAEEGEFELLRFCSKLETNVIGAASKLLKCFVDKIKPTKITTYADRRWSEGEMYKRLGFSLSHSSKPNYFYVVGLTRENRFKYRKSELVKEGYDTNKSEREIMLERGIYRIYDCGSNVFEIKF